jgi:dihydroorotate dehydrogenase (fumarate)
MHLTTHYMGLQLKNPLVASASPLSADLGNIRHLEDSGAAAIVLPSIEEQIEADRLHKTLAAVGLEKSADASGLRPEANQREPQQYLDLIRRAVEAVNIPIIGSLNGTTDEGWISYAKMIEEAGATSLELNVYLIPTDISLTGLDVEQRYLEILRAVRKAVDIPIAIKLGPYLSSLGQVAMEFVNAGADALVLLKVEPRAARLRNTHTRTVQRDLHIRRAQWFHLDLNQRSRCT